MTKPLPEDVKRQRAGARLSDAMFLRQKEEWRVYTRITGFKKFRFVSKHRKQEPAMVAMARAFTADRSIKRACVVHAVIPSWYDPTQICELVRR